MKVVIIGSGIGGLTAGAYLTKAGHKVEIFEQFSEIGGVTATIKKDGYAWDLGPLGLEGFGPHEAASRILQELDLYDKIELIEGDRGISIPSIDMIRSDEYKGPYWRRDILKKHFPEDAEGIDKYYKYYEKIMTILTLYDRATWSKGIKKRFLFLRIILKALPMVRKIKWTAKDFVDHLFTNPELKTLFVGILADFVVKPSEFIGLGVPRTNVERAYEKRIPVKRKGGLRPMYHYIKGGCGELVKVLANYITSNGGEIHTNTLVTKISIENGISKGVEIKGNKVIPADLVLASGGARMIYNELIGKENLPEELNERIETLMHMESVLMVHIGIDFDPTPYQRDALCYYYRTTDIEREVDLMRNGHYHEGKSGFLIYITSKHSPEMAPPGCHAVTVYTVAPDRLNEGTWEQRSEEMADKLLIEAEKIIPGLREHSKTEIIMTPADFRKRLHVDRHSFGGLAPVLGQKNPEANTPIINLWHIGCQNQWGGGVTGTMMGARRAIEQILGKKKTSKKALKTRF